MRLQSSLDIRSSVKYHLHITIVTTFISINISMHKNSCQGTVWCMSQEDKKRNVSYDKLQNSLIMLIFGKLTFYFSPTDVWARKREETNARSICPQSIVLSFLEAEGKERANPKLQLILKVFVTSIFFIEVCFIPSKIVFNSFSPKLYWRESFCWSIWGARRKGVT